MRACTYCARSVSCGCDENHASSNPGERLAIVCGVMAVFALSSNAAYALAGSLLRRWLAEGDRLLWFNRAMALLLLATAAWMALT